MSTYADWAALYEKSRDITTKDVPCPLWRILSMCWMQVTE